MSCLRNENEGVENTQSRKRFRSFFAIFYRLIDLNQEKYTIFALVKTSDFQKLHAT